MNLYDKIKPYIDIVLDFIKSFFKMIPFIEIVTKIFKSMILYSMTDTIQKYITNFILYYGLEKYYFPC
jgi:hypothetical protein